MAIQDEYNAATAAIAKKAEAIIAALNIFERDAAQSFLDAHKVEFAKAAVDAAEATRKGQA